MISPALPEQEPSLPAVTGRVLLVGWDAADWKIISPLLDRGEMPHLEGLINRGVMGDLLTLRPVLSPMLWNSIATGHRPERHGVHGFTEVDPATNTVRSVSSTTRKCKALWNIVNQAGGRAHVVNWYASHPAEPIRGINVSDALFHSQNVAPVPPGSVHPWELAEEFATYRMGLEDIDAAMLKLFVPRIEDVDQAKDRRLLSLARLLVESFTVHNVATCLLSDQPWNLAALYYPGIDHFCHGFMDFHPPQMPHVPDELYKLYSEVVTGGYRLHDLFLGRLLQLVDAETHIVLLSDHGFHSDHLRPRRIPAEPVGPAVQHRQHGIVVMAGSGVKRDERIYGAGLLDIAPTVLALLGLPGGEDMSGRVLVDAFIDPPAICTIPSWEEIAGDDGRHPPGFVAPSHDQSLVLEQFAALGYVDLEEMQGEVGPEACQRENEWNLAQSLMQGNNAERAADVLIGLCGRWPERGDFALVLAEALRQMGHAADARQLVESLVIHNPNTPPARYMLGVAALEEKKYAEAVAHLREVGVDYADRADLHQQMGTAFLRLGQRSDAEAAFSRAVKLDPHSANGWLGLTRCALRQRDWSLAEDRAMEAVRLDFNRPVAHALLGMARLRLGLRDDADLALRVACRQAPGWLYPRRLRALLWNGQNGEKSAIAVKEFKSTALKKSARKLSQTILPADRRAALDEVNRQLRQRSPIIPASATIDVAAVPLEVVVVSGLPRSGTSLMMQMLHAAGLPILTDGGRVSDTDNPEGYLEWEPIKNLPRQPELLRAADGKAVKIVSPLLQYLPQGQKYHVLFLDRPIDEILRSQLKMRQGRGAAEVPDRERLRSALTAHREVTLRMLKRWPNVRLMVVPYPALVGDPTTWSNHIAEFLGDRLPTAENMAQAIRPDLYRNRSFQTNS